ncbi:MAG: ATP-binding cassette domain-containing protein [Bacteroidetes bacterium]|nr:ATP-binding cassette domain-containing protein [Bacteroidota bacterium]HET6245764.1 ATP-binding cassette domain-containing protein [Bacteroidia bacterium]
MEILLKDIGKRYNNEWIFKGITHNFTKGNNYVILGSNGTGKSTLLQLIAGNFIPSEGNISYTLENKALDQEKIFTHISIATPYLDLIEEYTLTELIDFHSKFKPMLFDTEKTIEILDLNSSKNKVLKYFSSGMKQRVKLALAILNKNPLLLLDEPSSNLDRNSINWYMEMIKKYCSEKLIVVCSNNQKEEYFFCNKEIQIELYKTAKIQA